MRNLYDHNETYMQAKNKHLIYLGIRKSRKTTTVLRKVMTQLPKDFDTTSVIFGQTKRFAECLCRMAYDIASKYFGAAYNITRNKYKLTIGMEHSTHVIRFASWNEQNMMQYTEPHIMVVDNFELIHDKAHEDLILVSLHAKHIHVIMEYPSTLVDKHGGWLKDNRDSIIRKAYPHNWRLTHIGWNEDILADWGSVFGFTGDIGHD